MFKPLGNSWFLLLLLSLVCYAVLLHTKLNERWEHEKSYIKKKQLGINEIINLSSDLYYREK